MKYRALYGFSRKSDGALIDAINKVLSSMHNNSHFPDPSPSLDELKSELQTFEKLRIKVQERTQKEVTVEKNQVRKNLEALMAKLAQYVNNIADGDLSLLDSSGFDLNRKPHKKGIKEPPKSFEIANTSQRREVAVHIEKVEGADAYVINYRKDGDEYECSTFFNKTKGVIKNLDSTTRYYFKVASVTPEATDTGTYRFSEEKSFVIQ